MQLTTGDSLVAEAHQRLIVQSRKGIVGYGLSTEEGQVQSWVK